jgi:hypothetical protein
MSGLVGTLLQAGGGQALEMLGGRFGLGPAQTRAALEALGPMVAGGLRQQAEQRGGLEGLIGGVLNQGHAAYGVTPDNIARPGTTAAGNEILGAIFGSKDVSRAVAGQAAAQTGISADILKQMLPVVAMMAAGALARGAGGSGLGNLLGAVAGGAGGAGMLGNLVSAAMSGGGASGAGGGLGALLGAAAGAVGGGPAGGAPAQPGGGLGALASMIDMDRDGNPLDDILRMVGRG